MIPARAGWECIFMGWWLTWAVAFWACLNSHAQGYFYHPLPTQEQLPVANVNVIAQDYEGYMWYGTAGGGLCRDDGYRVVTYNSKTAGRGVMESDEVTCLAEDQTGRMWFGTRAGLYYINNVDGSVCRVNHELVGLKKVNCLGVTHDGCVWVGIQRSVVKFSKTGAYLTSLSIGDNTREEVKEMMVDRKGMLWLTILRGGIVSIDPKTNRLNRQPWNYPHAASYIVEDTVRHCYWVGTWGGGIVRYPDMRVETASLIATEQQHFGSEVYNLWIDQREQMLWAATMDDVYAYKMETGTLVPHHLQQGNTTDKKIIRHLMADRRGNVWVPGFSPHTFIVSKIKAGERIDRDEVKAMSEQMGYKIMVQRIAHEGRYRWIYQNRTRLSLYDTWSGQLTFMATNAMPEPLSTQAPLARCKTDRGVWTCNGRKLIHAWNEGMQIHWQEVEEGTAPNYITALADEGNGRLLIGTGKQVLLYDYKKKTLKELTDSVGIVQQVASPRNGLRAESGWQTTKGGEAVFTTDPKAAKQIRDRQGHIWTLNELTLQEYSPRTGACRTILATDKQVGMDYFTDITLAGDSICLGGVGAVCMVGVCKELDLPHADDAIVVTGHDSLNHLYISTMNHLHASSIQFAYRLDSDEEWTELPVGENCIDLTEAGFGTHTLYAKATDEFGVWHKEQEIYRFILPLPWWLRWWAWCIYLAIALMVGKLVWEWKRKQKEASANRMEALSELTANTTPPQATEPEESKEDPFLLKVKEIVQANLDNAELSVDDLSRQLGMSRMNLYRKFQSVSDTTPSEYMRIYRLKKGAELLRTTDDSITEIAYKVGFTSPQYFAKCFKDEFQMSPRQYRENK